MAIFYCFAFIAAIENFAGTNVDELQNLFTIQVEWAAG